MRVRTVIIEVVWRWTRLNWQIMQHYADGTREAYASERRKADAILDARALGRELGARQGRDHPVELQVKTKLGRIAFKDSYGSDSPRVPG